MKIPTLHTSRLCLEPLGRQHSAGMYALWSCPQVCEFSGPAYDLEDRRIPLPAVHPRDSDRIIEFFLAQTAWGRASRWGILLLGSERFIGAAGFNSLGSCSEIAYHLHPDYWGNGFMTEACLAAIEWAFQSHGAGSLEAFIEPKNQRSIRLIERLGFVRARHSRAGATRYLMER